MQFLKIIASCCITVFIHMYCNYIIFDVCSKGELFNDVMGRFFYLFDAYYLSLLFLLLFFCTFIFSLLYNSVRTHSLAINFVL